MHVCEAKGRGYFSQNSQEICNFLNDLGFKKGEGENWTQPSLRFKKPTKFLTTRCRSVLHQHWLAALDDGG